MQAAAIVRRDGKADVGYISRRLGITTNKALYVSSVLTELGLIGEDGTPHFTDETEQGGSSSSGSDFEEIGADHSDAYD